MSWFGSNLAKLASGYITPKNPSTLSTPADAVVVAPEANCAEISKVSAELTPGVALVARRDHYWRRVHENSTALTGRAIVTERAINVATERCQAEHVRLRSLQKELSSLPHIIATLKDTALQLEDIRLGVLALEEQLGVKTEEKACRELALWKKKRDKKHDDFKADKKRDVLVLEANLKLTQDKEIRAAKLKDEAAKKAEQARADEERRKQRDEEYLRKKAEEAAASKGQSTAVSSSAPSASSSTNGGAPEGVHAGNTSDGVEGFRSEANVTDETKENPGEQQRARKGGEKDQESDEADGP